MAAHPKRHAQPAPTCRLAPFDPVWADHVIGWVRTPQEAYWLAPKTPPPLTGDRLTAWHEPGHEPYMLLSVDRPLHVAGAPVAPLAYGELNRLSSLRREYWLGHLVVDPQERGRGLGIQLTRLLLQEAFEQRGARRVTLVVFPDNDVAFRCYRAAGMYEDGYEWHAFPAYNRRERLVRLAATREFWR